MKSRIVLGLFAVLLTLAGAVAVPVIWNRIHTLYPTSETESAFLKNYTPQHVIEAYQCSTQSSAHVGPSGGGEAGDKFVTHHGGFEWFFAMRSDKWTPLMTALNNDAYQQLVANGAQILSQSGNPRDGFRYDYKLGKSIGTLTILPLAITSPSLIHRREPLPVGTLDVTARIEQKETWFPKEPGSMQIQASKDSIHQESAISQQLTHF
jgi:hypothetical protein